MSKFLEGEWNNFVFRKVFPEDYPKILKLLRETFYLDEPLGNRLGMGSSPEAMDELDKFTLKYLKAGISFYAMEKGTNKIVGVRISSIEHKKTTTDDAPEPQKFKSPIIKTIVTFLDKCSRVDVHDHFGIDKYGYLVMTAVDREFRGKGIATELYHRVLAQFKELGITHASCVFTSPYTRKAAVKLGFEELAREQFSDHKDNEGNELIPNSGPEDFGAFMVLKIN